MKKIKITFIITIVFIACVFFSCKRSDDQNIALFPVLENGKWGYIDSTGNMVIEPQFMLAYPFSEGLAWVVTKGNLFEFDATSNIEELVKFGMFRSSTGAEWCAIDPKGEIVFKTVFNSVRPVFKEGLSPVLPSSFKKTWGFCNKQGLLVIEDQFSEAGMFSNGFSLIKTGEFGDYIFINLAGQQAFPVKYAEARSFNEGLAAAKKDSLWGYIDSTGAYAIQPQFADAGNFSDGLAIVRKDTALYFIDKAGNKAFDIAFDDVENFSDGLAKFITEAKYDTSGFFKTLLSGKFGFIDKKGKVAINPVFDVIPSEGFSFDFRLYDFHDGMALLKKDGKYGYIDKSGKIIVEPVFEEGFSFSNGLAKVKKDGKWSYINKKGVAVWTQK